MATKKKFNWEAAIEDIANRAVKTFVQALGGGFLTLVLSGDTSGVKVAIASAVAAALAVVWNAVLAWASR